jgi:rhodanese-related sulfurtransferase
VYVAPDLLATEPLISGDEPTEPIPAPEGVLTTDLQALRDGLDAGETVMVDVADSRTYAAGHIPEAWFAIRARLTEERPVLPEAVRYVITSPTGELAGLAVGELQELTSAPVLALKGGTAAWAAAGLPIETGIGRRLTEPDDLWGPDVNDEEQFRAFFAEYRVWCEQVAGQIERTGGWE